MRFWILFGMFLLCLSPSLYGQELSPVRQLRHPTIRLEQQREFASGTDRAPSPAQVRGRAVRLSASLVEQLQVLRGDGGGADIGDESMQVVQTRFVNDVDSDCGFPEDCEGPCNTIVVSWREDTENPSGVDVLFNGTLVLTVPGLPAEELPGTNSVLLFGAPAGTHTVLIEDQNSLDSETCETEVLDDKPFTDPSDVRAEDAGDDDSSFCKLFARWENTGVWPDAYFVSFDGQLYGGNSFGGATQDVLIDPNVVPEGGNLQSGSDHTLAVQAFSAGPGCTFYLGCNVAADITATCEEETNCDALGAVRLQQSTYGDFVTIDATWVNAESTYVTVEGFIDDASLGTLAGDAQGAVISGGIPPGVHTLGFLPSCAEGFDMPAVSTADIEIFAESPYTNAIESDPTCEFDDVLGTITTTWSYGEEDPPAFGIISIVILDPDTGEEAVIPLGRFSGSETTATITGTDGSESVVLQFFRSIDGAYYGSPDFRCDLEESRFFIRGACGSDTDTNPQITNAIAIFGFLFLGSDEPSCLEACNADGQGDLNLSDGIYLLNFLFLGGTPPPGYVGVDPSCEPITEEIDCVTESSSCPLGV